MFHCDIRPANFLVTEHLELRLCDFGGSKSREVYGRGLPNAGFYDPRDGSQVSQSTDIFALGSCMYTIMTGQFPHGKRGRMTYEEEHVYNEEVKQLLLQGHFPDVRDTAIGHIISACWKTCILAKDVLREFGIL